MASKWTSDQTRIVLRSVLIRLRKDDKDFTLKNEGHSVTISSYRAGTQMYISLNKSDNQVYMSIMTHSGFYTPSVFFWRDQDIKRYIKAIKDIAFPKAETMEDAILKCFPEALDQEFETAILTKKK